MLAAILITCSAQTLLTGCQHKDTDIRPVAGILDEPLPADSAPSQVLAAIDAAVRFHQHEIMNDTINEVSVWSLDEVDTTSTEGYGFVVTKGVVSTTLTHIRNTRQPSARYDSESGNLWLTSSAMEGTGVQVERLYLIRFQDDGTAFVAATADPYDVQQAMLSRLEYSINGQEVTFYDGQQHVATATNTVTDMGGFDSEEPIWIGEQLSYDLSGADIKVQIVPGVKFTTGLVLSYDDMPTLSIPLHMTADGSIILGDSLSAD